MENLDVVFCPDCGIYYLKMKDVKTKEEKYSYADDFSEFDAKKILDDVYQCAECGALYQIDPHSADNSKNLIRRFNIVSPEMNLEFFAVEFESVFGCEPTVEQLQAFVDYSTHKTNDISGFLNFIEDKSKNNDNLQPQKQ